MRHDDTWLSAIAADASAVSRVAPGLYSALPREEWAAPYDRRAAAYEAVVKRPLYNRVLWGTLPRSYTQFGRDALDAADGGNFAEIGAGSLLFTGHLYGAERTASITLVDRSMTMLQRGIARMNRRGGVPDQVVALHADAAALPVRTGIFTSVLCLHVLHVACDRRAIVQEIGRSLVPGRGRLFVSSLVRSGRWSDAYMSLLHRAGELGPPMTRAQLLDTVAGEWGVVESERLEGNRAKGA